MFADDDFPPAGGTGGAYQGAAPECDDECLLIQQDMLRAQLNALLEQAAPPPDADEALRNLMSMLRGLPAGAPPRMAEPIGSGMPMGVPGADVPGPVPGGPPQIGFPTPEGRAAFEEALRRSPHYRPSAPLPPAQYENRFPGELTDSEFQRAIDYYRRARRDGFVGPDDSFVTQPVDDLGKPKDGPPIHFDRQDGRPTLAPSTLAPPLPRSPARWFWDQIQPTPEPPKPFDGFTDGGRRSGAATPPEAPAGPAGSLTPQAILAAWLTRRRQ